MQDADWSPDGTQIWFTVFANDTSRVYTIPSGGGDPKAMGSVPGRALRLSPDGKRIAYAVNTSYDVLRVGDAYFACWQGAWFTAPVPSGPWTLAPTVPAVPSVDRLIM